jgi:TPR repeat protein
MVLFCHAPNKKKLKVLLVNAGSVRRIMQSMFDEGDMCAEDAKAWSAQIVERDDVIALSENGDCDAMVKYARWIYVGSKGINRSTSKALNLYARAAALGSFEALFMMSEIYRARGSEYMAMSYLLQAAQLGSQKACYCLAQYSLASGLEGYRKWMSEMLCSRVKDASEWQVREATNAFAV